MGVEEADGGSIQFSSEARIGVVEQNEILPSDTSTLAYLEGKSEKPEWEARKLASQFGLHAEHLEKAPRTFRADTKCA